MGDPPSSTSTVARAVVIAADERTDERGDVAVDVDRWRRLAGSVLDDERRAGELTLTFVDRDEIAALNAQHLGHDGPTDVLSFPIDDAAADTDDVVPVLLGDVVVCPAVAAEQAADHAGTLDDELALLVVHGILHVTGHDHADPPGAAAMQRRTLDLLQRHHWNGPAPAGFGQDHGRETP